MPVELEGYIRPGCIILTVFVAMPRFMWMKVIAQLVISLDSDSSFPLFCSHLNEIVAAFYSVLAC